MKRKFLTFALLATVAVGGAFAGNVTKTRLTVTAGPLGAPTSQCNTSVECTTTDQFPCKIGDVEYAQNRPQTGLCTIALFQPQP